MTTLKKTREDIEHSKEKFLLDAGFATHLDLARAASKTLELSDENTVKLARILAAARTIPSLFELEAVIKWICLGMPQQSKGGDRRTENGTTST